MKKTRAPFKTPKPTISEAQLAVIRHAAKQYLLAGGSMTIAADDAGDRDEFVGNIRLALKPRTMATFETVLKADVPEYDAHERVWTAAVTAMADEAEAGYLFGVAVGLEVAAMTLGTLVASAPSKGRSRKGGAR